MGTFYLEGTGVVQDPLEAFNCFSLSAAQVSTHIPLTTKFVQNDPGAMNNLGLMYDNGIGVEQDFKQAILWFQRSMELGEGKAAFNLAQMYRLGKGVKLNRNKALQLMNKSVEFGNLAGQIEAINIQDEIKEAERNHL